MKDRGMIKWKPFNAVVPSKTLLKDLPKVKKPNLSQDEIENYEEIIKISLYDDTPIEITYLYKNTIKKDIKTVIKLDSINKNIFFKDKTKINFRQIYKISQI